MKIKAKPITKAEDSLIQERKEYYNFIVLPILEDEWSLFSVDRDTIISSFLIRYNSSFILWSTRSFEVLRLCGSIWIDMLAFVQESFITAHSSVFKRPHSVILLRCRSLNPFLQQHCIPLFHPSPPALSLQPSFIPFSHGLLPPRPPFPFHHHFPKAKKKIYLLSIRPNISSLLNRNLSVIAGPTSRRSICDFRARELRFHALVYTRFNCCLLRKNMLASASRKKVGRDQKRWSIRNG
jgi:hypothetical protein